MNKRNTILASLLVFGIAFALLFAGCTPLDGSLEEIREKAREENFPRDGQTETIYNVSVILEGDVATSDSVTRTPISGKHGTIITLNYSIDYTEQFNWLEFGGVNELNAVIIENNDTPGSAITGRTTYTIDAVDATEGNIAINAKFNHLDLRPDPISFKDYNSGTVTMRYGDSPSEVVPGSPPKLIFTNVIATEPKGTGAITYSNPVIERTVATVDSNTGVVTILKIGSTTITATKAADETYAEATAQYTLTITIATPGAPAAPTVKGSDTNSVELNKPAGANNLFVLEYGISKSNNATNAYLWQEDDLYFGGLDNLTAYYFFARYKENLDKNEQSAASTSVSRTTSNLQNQTIAFPDPSEVPKTYGDAAFTIKVSNEGLGSGAITYRSGDTNVATVNRDSGQVTIVKAGSTTIYADKAADTTYNSTTANYTLNIDKKTITISGVTATGREYNGLETVSLSGGTLNGIVGGDSVGFSLGTGTVANVNAGTGRAVSTNIQLSGNADDISNYTLTQPSGITVTISAKTLLITGVGATSREYNGLTAVALTGGSLSGVVGGETVGFTLGTGTVSAGVGNGKAVTTSIQLSGSAPVIANYSLMQPTDVTVNITPKPLTIGIGSSSRTLIPYNVAADANFGTNTAISVSVSGLIDPDIISFNLTPSAGLSLTTNTGIGNTSSHNLTLTYDGRLLDPLPASITLTIPVSDNYSYTTSHNVNVTIQDGYDPGRAITVTTAGIWAFNSYANTTDGLGRHYKLNGNIAIPGADTWIPIGTKEASFGGSFDGLNYSISNLVIDSLLNSRINLGFFGYINQNSTVKQLKLAGCKFMGNYFDDSGGIVGQCEGGKIQNCSVSGDFEFTIEGGQNIGFVVGVNTGTVENCSITADYTNYETVGLIGIGGIVGYNQGTVSNCHALEGSKIALFACNSVGGIVGKNENVIKNCSSKAFVMGFGDVGGLVGSNGISNDSRLTGTISECYAIATVYGFSGAIGGLVGYNYDHPVSTGLCAIIANSYAGGTLTGYEAVGGIAGFNKGVIDHCYATNSISECYDYAGGIVGYNTYWVKSCVALNPDITGPSESTSLSYGRISGTPVTTDTANNHAQSEMVIVSGATGHAGTATTAYNTSTFWSSLGYDLTTVWQMPGSEPPTLRRTP